MALPDEIRAACARVAAAARHVRIVDDAVAPYAATLAAGARRARRAALRGPGAGRGRTCSSSTRSTSARAGSPRCASRRASRASAPSSAACSAHGPWSAAALRRVDAAECAAVFGQEPGHPLMALFATALAELGRARRAPTTAARFLALARAGDGSAVALAEHLAALPTWRDVSTYDGAPVPLFKRAQLTAADLHRHGLAPAADVGALTLMADNLVPHVLRIDGVLEFDAGARGPDRPRGAARARLARGGRDPRLRRPCRRAARRRPRRHHRRGRRRRAVAPRRRARATRRTRATGRARRPTEPRRSGARGRRARAARRRPCGAELAPRSTSRSGWRSRSRAASPRNSGRPIRRSIRSSRHAPSK